MSHPLFWLSKLFFYPIGNTAPISLTQDLSPEQSADLLLLGCGDPRNILFTLYSDLTRGSVPREMDVTCCDIEPAILARNILLFSLIESHEHIDLVWDIFYHFKINDSALKLLTRHSQQLFDSSRNMEAWRHSQYNSFLKIVDSRTLAELSRCWESYAEFRSLPAKRLQQLQKEQADLSKSVLKDNSLNLSSSRSAGILWNKAMIPVAKLFRRYWETGTTFNLARDIKLATNLNPTFVYSLSGEVFNPHYGSFPTGFHLAPAFSPISSDPAGPLEDTGSAAIDVSKQQFKAWCQSFGAAREAGAITIRFYSGEALAFCHALKVFSTTGNPLTNIFVSPWRAPQIILDEFSTAVPQAPTTFDVIDTSNLTDHLGLLNLLIATQPLLKMDPESQSVLFTETLLALGEDPTQSFLERIFTDIPTIGLMLGLVPRPYVSTFATHSNTHELLFSNAHKLSSDCSDQFHERVAWVDPSSGDQQSYMTHPTVTFEVEDLARALFSIYDKMFANEDILKLVAKPSSAGLESMGEIRFQRETIALLFRAIRTRVRVHNGNWDQAVDRFLKTVEFGASRLSEYNNYQDLCLQLHLHGVYSVPALQPHARVMSPTSFRSNIFDHWPDVPPVLCLVLTVPRKSLKVLLDEPAERIGSPTLQCFLRVEGGQHNTYTAIHAVWGKCVTSPKSDSIVIQEDLEGMNGKADLVVSFWAQTHILEFPGTKVALSIKPTPQAVSAFMEKLGLQLALFDTSVTNEQHVQLLAYRPTLASEAPQTPHSSDIPQNYVTPNCVCQAIVERQGESFCVKSLSARVEIKSVAEQESMHNGAVVSALQVAPCTIQLIIDQHRHSISFPYPIKGNNHRLRIARRSHYVEVIVPVSKPLDQTGYFLNPFPILHRNAYTPWNIHHLNLERLPVLNTNDPKEVEWLNYHCAFQLSDRELPIRNADQPEKDAAENVLLNVKDSIISIMLDCSGVQGRRTRALTLKDPGNGGVYMVFLVGGIRLDLASSTVAIDTAAVPLSKDMMPHLLPGIQRLFDSGTLIHTNTIGHEVVAWKRLLPAFVERCRTWTHKPNCEYSSQEAIPLSVEIDQNPICTCGQGVGFTASEWNVPEWKDLLPFATRAAISPIFSVSYIEPIMGKARAQILSGGNRIMNLLAAGAVSTTVCWGCGGPGKPNLFACSRCKKARYCSVICQRQNWKEHKGKCRKE